MQLDPPKSLADGRYTILEKIGEGGMASVYRAHDEVLGVERAIKLLHATDNVASRAALRERLRAEARAMAGLSHPNILSVHDVGAEGDRDYIVMDLARGGSLRTRLEEEGPTPPEQAVEWTVGLLSALASAHANAIVHRDVKPQNILLDESDRPLLADFGIAMLASLDLRRTRTGVAMGSLAYMPPEQRLDAAGVDHRADLYAAGATLYTLLTASSAVDLFLVGPDDPRFDQVPEVLIPIIRAATSADPDQRPTSAGAMAAALLDTQLGHPTSLPFPPPQAMPPRTSVVTTRPQALPRNRIPTVGSTGHLGPTIYPRERGAPRLWIVGALALVMVAALVLLWPSPPDEEIAAAAESDDEIVSIGPSLDDFQPAPVVPASARPGPLPIRELPPAAPKPDPVPVVPAPRSHGPPPRGSWLVTDGATKIHLFLTGDNDALTGTVTYAFAAKEESYAVTGTYASDTGALYVKEIDGPGIFTATIPAGATQGKDGVMHNGNRTRTILLRRP